MIKYRTKLIEKLTHGKSGSHLVKSITGKSKPPEVVTCFGSYKVNTRPLIDWQAPSSDESRRQIRLHFTYSRNNGPIQRVMIDENTEDWDAIDLLYSKLDTDLCRAQDGESLAFYLLSDDMGVMEQVIPELNDIHVPPPILIPPIEATLMRVARVPERPLYDYTITGIGGDGLIPIKDVFNVDARTIAIPQPLASLDLNVEFSGYPRWYPKNDIVKEDNTIVIYPSDNIDEYDFDLFNVLGGIGNTPITINSCVKAVPNKYNCMASYVVGSQAQGLILTRQALTESDVQSTEYREPIRFSDAPFPFKAAGWSGYPTSWPQYMPGDSGTWGYDWVATYRRNDGPLKTITWNTGSLNPGSHHSVWDAIKELLLDDYGRTAFMLSDFNSTAPSFNGDGDVTVKSGIGSNLKFTNRPSEEGEPTHLSNQSYRYAGKSVEVRDRQIQFSDESAGAVWNENTITIYPTPLEVINDYGFDGQIDYYEYLCQYYDQLEAGEPITIHSCAAVEPADHIQVNTNITLNSLEEEPLIMGQGLSAAIRLNDGAVRYFKFEPNEVNVALNEILTYLYFMGKTPEVTISQGDGTVLKINDLYFRSNFTAHSSEISGCSGTERDQEFWMPVGNPMDYEDPNSIPRVSILETPESYKRESNKATFIKHPVNGYVDLFDLIKYTSGDEHTIYSSAVVPSVIWDRIDDNEEPVDPEPVEGDLSGIEPFTFTNVSKPGTTGITKFDIGISNTDGYWEIRESGQLIASPNHRADGVGFDSNRDDYKSIVIYDMNGVTRDFEVYVRASTVSVRIESLHTKPGDVELKVTSFGNVSPKMIFRVGNGIVYLPETFPPHITDCEGMFNNGHNIGSDITGWDMSNVTNMAFMFADCRAFNQDISGWDVSNVTQMHSMFWAAYKFNQDLSTWCVSNILSYPNGFASEANAWTLPKPVWGTCPATDSQGRSFSFRTVNALGSSKELPLKVNLTATGNPWSLIDVDNGGVIASDETLGGGVGAKVGLYLDSSGAESRMYRLEGPVNELSIALEGDSSPDGLLEVTSFSDDISEYRYNLKDADILVPTTLPSHITSLDYMFAGCLKFDQDITGWDTTNVTSMEGTFKGCSTFNQDISRWDVSKVTTMESAFEECTSFDQDLSTWNTVSLTNLSRTFTGCSSFNSSLTNWNVSQVTKLDRTFTGATSFNQPLSNWNVGMAYTLRECFAGAVKFNQDISAWNVERVEDMQYTFAGASSFNQDLSVWVTASLLNLEGTFKDAVLFNSDLSLWDTSQVVTLSSTFQGATAFNQPLNDWDVSKVHTMQSTFAGAVAFNQPLNDWDVSNVSGSFPMYGMFEGATLFNQDLSSWCVPDVEYINKFDEGATSWSEPRPPWGYCGLQVVSSLQFTITTGDVAPDKDRLTIGFPEGMPGTFKILKDGVLTNTSPAEPDSDIMNQYGQIAIYVPPNTTRTFTLQASAPVAQLRYYTGNTKSTNKIAIDAFSDNILRYEFSIHNAGLTVPQTIPVHITSMFAMFKDSNRFNQDLSGWDVSRITNATDAFRDCVAFNGDVGTWRLDKLGVAQRMFKGCKVFNQPLNNWRFPELRVAIEMFSGCSAFNQDLNSWNVSGIRNFEGMFSGCTVFNGNIVDWDMTGASSLNEMFYNCQAFNQPIGNWNVASVSNFDGMFSYATSFNQDISTWDMSGVKNVKGLANMFAQATGFNHDLSTWNVLKVPSRPYEFDSGLTTTWKLPRPKWGTDGKP